MKENKIIIGEGWAAIAAVAKAVLLEQSVTWISGTGSRFRSPLPTLEEGAAMETWREIAQGFQIETGESQTGSYLREYRNKAFREPLWTKAPTPESRREVIKEILWAPELRLVPVFESRFGLSMGELETQLRSKLEALAEEKPELLKRFSGVPLSSFKQVEDHFVSVTLGSGEEIACSSIIYADRWSALLQMEGFPKPLTFNRKRSPSGLLQAVFTHETPMAIDVREGFFSSLHKETGEEQERHFFGYFSSDGLQSVWTLCLSPEEGEDNHEITKKLRRMKSALDKIFAGESWLPAGKGLFMDTVKSEKVNFEEAIIFSEGEPLVDPIRLGHISNLDLITDGYGPSSAAVQAFRSFASSHEGANAETESMNVPKPVAT